jgi:hypothetical protein
MKRRFDLGARVAANDLRRLSEGAQERPPHAFAVGKSGLAGDDVDWMPALLHHQARGFDAQILNGLRGRLSRLRAKSAAELAWAEIGRIRKLIDGQRGMKIVLGIDERALNPIRFGIELEQRGILQLAAGTPVKDHEFFCD